MTDFDKGSIRNSTAEFLIFTAQAEEQSIEIRYEDEDACPPEDCGGVWGYSDLLEAVANPDQEERIEWMGGDFDPDAFDLEEVNTMLAEWRKGG